MDLIAEKSFLAFFIITVVLGGGAAFLAGRALALTWRSLAKVLFYMLLLGAGVRFLHWGLFLDATLPSWRGMQGTLLSLHYYAVDTLVLMCAATLGYRLERARQMTTQYRWIYQRTSPFTWRAR
jgi:hypothetical protein